MNGNCSKCNRPWDEHEFAVPAPYCPIPINKLIEKEANATTERMSKDNSLQDMVSKLVKIGEEKQGIKHNNLFPEIPKTEYRGILKLGDNLPLEYYNGIPGEYLCQCISCDQIFGGDKRDCCCPKCRNGGRIVSAYLDEAWILYDADGNIVAWPSDWPDTVDTKFMEHRGIKVI